MDTTSIITTIVLLVLCILLVIIIKNKSHNRKKAALADLLKLAAENNSSITVSDFWQGRTSTKIAIDTNKMLLFFIRKINDTETKLVLELSEVIKTNLLTKSRSAGEGKAKQTVIDSVNLELSFKAKDKSAIGLEFYNNESDSPQISDELQLAEKWVALINKTITC